MSSSHKRDPFGSTPNHNQVAAKCVCNRPTTTVFCTACKAMCEGRVYSVCCVHPNLCFFQDMKQCSQCHSCSSLIELDEEILRRVKQQH